MPVLTVGKTAPHFDLGDAEGKKLSLQGGLARGPVLVAFFKVSCPTCQYTFPFLERLFQQVRPQGAQIWGIVQDEARDAQKFAKQYGVTFPILIDNDPYKISREYGLKYVPTILLIEPHGHVVVSSEGFCKVDLLAIQKSLAQSLSASPGPLFLATDKVPEYKPG